MILKEAAVDLALWLREKAGSHQRAVDFILGLNGIISRDATKCLAAAEAIESFLQERRILEEHISLAESTVDDRHKMIDQLTTERDALAKGLEEAADIIAERRKKWYHRKDVIYNGKIVRDELASLEARIRALSPSSPGEPLPSTREQRLERMTDQQQCHLPTPPHEPTGFVTAPDCRDRDSCTRHGMCMYLGCTGLRY